MVWEIVTICLLLLQTWIPPTAGYGESDSAGHPNYQERANHVFLNAVRVAPTQYKTVYMAGYSPSPASILGTTYPARPPLYLEPRLVNSAYYHSNDMATNGCFSHSSCNGTDTFVRIKSYYSCSGTLGENIAAGYADPLDTNNQWLCDLTAGACAADGGGSDGHRKNIMSASYKVVGTGYAYQSTATYRHYWTQDFGGAACAPAPTSPIYGGSHRIKSGTILFITVFYSSVISPSTPTVVVSGTSYSLALDIGTAGSGTYTFSQPSGTACRPYYFTIGGYRYPETGCLVTYGEGTCLNSFDATCGGTTAAVSSASATTTAAVTSASATTTAAATVAAVSTSGTASVTTATASTTGGGVYYLYSTTIQNSWVLQYNTGVTISNSYAYSGKTGLRVKFGTTASTTYVLFNHVPAVTNAWTNLQFYVAASSASNVLVFFNGGVSQSKAVTPTWQFYSIPLSAIYDPTTGVAYTAFGAPRQLVFQQSGGTGLTLYLNSIAFV